MKTRIVVLASLTLLFLGLGFFWWKISLTPVNPTSKTLKIFVVKKGEGVREIASRLKKEGLIRDQIVFFLLVKKLGIDQSLQAGDFRLNPAMDAQTIAQTLTRGMLDVWVTILEGWRNEEIALKFAQELFLPEAQFLQYAEEGYMFPDTYLIPKEATATAIVKILKDNFDKKFSQDLEEEALKNRLTKEEAIILASIVEKEASGEEDRGIIAGILLKRLKKGWPLQADATIQYILGYQPEERTWWKKSLTNADKKIVSLYNTYQNPGLPPGPISNPGLASIKAVVYPVDSDFWYYLHDQEGKVHFAKTIEEHEENIAKYLR
ncbi:endolytic transglycosylase MltG [Candidatus Gottesmanbacteria bacterium]|nr:endolytic transglycosylase MltG [Candidatus Gottesmanbacteria bacterium]MBI5465155.1 endolytic transglycosylase MltG [Candidatus Gottesmanbacteria bacterium]